MPEAFPLVRGGDSGTRESPVTLCNLGQVPSSPWISLIKGGTEQPLLAQSPELGGRRCLSAPPGLSFPIRHSV